MRNSIYKFVTDSIRIILIIVAGATPLLFLDLTTEFYSLPKLIFLIFATILLLGLWTLSWVVRGKIVIVRTPLDFPLLLLLITIIASMWFSSSRFSSIFGVFPETHGSAISWAVYIILYFVAVSNLKKLGQVKLLVYVLLFSAAVVSAVSILSFFGIFLPFKMSQGVNFTPTGATFSTTALLLMLLPLSLLSIVKKNKYLPQIIAAVLSVLFGIAVVLISPTLYSVLLFGLLMFVPIISRKGLSGRGLTLYLITVILCLTTLVLVNVKFGGNFLQESKAGFPQEVQLPMDITWKISISAFRDAPFVGTGPATFLYNFNNYKPAEFNRLDFWNFSFGSGYNEYLQALGVWGAFGLLSLIVLSVVALSSAGKQLFSSKTSKTDNKGDARLMLSGLSMSTVLAVFLFMLHSTTLVSIVTTFLLIASFMAAQKQIREKASEFAVGVSIASSKKRQIDILPVLVFVLFLVAAVPVSARTYDAAFADYYHRLALVQADSDGTKTYEYLQRAESLNPYIDLYRVDMAQTNFALANALAEQKGPTQENPEGTLTPEERETIQTLVTQSINEGRASVVLSPRSSRNWQVLALIYKNISGVANNSLTFALDAYGRAIQVDPMNPALRVEVGSLYYSTGDYDMAIRFFTDAVNLKADYVNGYYNLAIALRQRGDLENARRVAEQAIQILQQDFGSSDYSAAAEIIKQTKQKDFNTVLELLNQIRSEIDNGTQNTQDDTGLQNPDLPDINVPVLEGSPPNILPPQVEENPDAVLPESLPESAPPVLDPNI